MGKSNCLYVCIKTSAFQNNFLVSIGNSNYFIFVCALSSEYNIIPMLAVLVSLNTAVQPTERKCTFTWRA